MSSSKHTVQNVRTGPTPHYLHKDAHAHRAGLTSGPSVPTHYKEVPPEAGFNGNIHEHVARRRRTP